MPSSDMDADRPKSRVSEDGTCSEHTDDFIIGDRVWVNGTKAGYIQYLGEVQFSPGDWAGVVLDDHSGKNDGSVAGVRYFQCEAKRGVFARPHRLTKYPMVHATASSKLMGDSPTPPPIQRCLTPTRTPSPGARNLREGDRVTVSSSTGPPKTGVLRYIGQTDFAAGEWAGVELDEPLGKNDGTVAGKRYFKCSPNCGLFSPPHKVTRMTGSLDRNRRTHHHSGSEKENSSKNSSTQNLQDEKQTSKYAEESEKRAERLRQLLEVAEAERRQLASKLDEERRKVEELEFRIEEECIGKDDIELEREKEKWRMEDLQRKLEEERRKNEMISEGATPDSILQDQIRRLNEELVSMKEKLKLSEFELQELRSQKKTIPPPSTGSNAREELMRKDEALLQAQLSLDNKRREVNNLLDRMAELERDLEKSRSRQSRQLDTIDELNVKLQKAESKCTSLEDEILVQQEKTEELERRLKASIEQSSLLELEKRRLEEKLLSPESTSKEQEILSRLQDRETEITTWRKEAEDARRELDESRKEREKTKKTFEERIRCLKDEHEEDFRKQKKRAAESEEASKMKIRDLEHIVSQVRMELESARTEADVRLSRQEARLQEARLKSEDEDRLRDQISRLQAEKDLIRVEKEEMWKRFQTSEKSRQRWESEANNASDEVNLLKSQVQHLRTEFMTHRDDLVKKLAETEFDSKVVQDLHLQIEEQRRLVEKMTQKLKWTEGERDQLQTSLSTRKVQVENGLRQEMDTLKRRLSEVEAEKQSMKRSLEASQLLSEEKTASVLHQQREEMEKLRQDKFRLEQSIRDMQVELSNVKNVKTEPSNHITQIIKDKEALEQQVNFLNSVIVDMQHKNDDLKSKLDILETEVIFDGHLALGIPTRTSSQVFCDICDIYNLHDTEDCPKQRTIRRNQSYSSQESEF